MKSFKKVLVSLVVSLMFVTASLTFNFNAIMADESSIIEKVINAIEKANEESFDNAKLGDNFYYRRATEIYNLSVENKTLNIKQTQINNVTNGSSKSIFSYIGIAFDVFKALGILMNIIPDEEEETQKYIISRFDAIDEKLKSIEGSLDKIYKTLTEQFQQIDKDLKVLNIGQKKQDITSFYDNYTSQLLRYVNTFNVGIRGQIKSWYSLKNVDEFKRFFDDNSDTFKLSFNEKEYNGRQTKDVPIEISFPVSYIVDKLIEYRDIQRHPWNSDCQEVVNFFTQIVTDIIKDPSAVLKQENAQFVEWLRYAYVENNTNPWKDLSAEEISNRLLLIRAMYFSKESKKFYENITNKFVEGAWNNVITAGTRNYAKNAQGTPDNFVGTLTYLFNEYCDSLNGKKAQSFQIDSAYKNTLDIYGTIYNFQKELDVSFDYQELDGQGKPTGRRPTINSNVAELSLNKYLYELSNLGNFVAMMAVNSGVYNKEQLINDVYVPWAETEQKLKGMYNEFYKKDEPFYCYSMGKAIELKTGELKGTIYGKKSLDDGGLIHDMFDEAWKDDYTFSYKNIDILGDTAVRKIYGTYLANGGKPNGFYDYLNNIFGYGNTRYSQFLITSFLGTENIHKDDVLDMKCRTMMYMGPECPESWYYHDADSVRVAYDGGNNKEFHYLQLSMKAVASTFDMINAKSDTRTILNAMAVGNVKRPRRDEMGILFANTILSKDGWPTNWNSNSYNIDIQNGYDRWKQGSIPHVGSYIATSRVTNTGRFYVLVPKGTKETSNVSLGESGSENLLDSMDNRVEKEFIKKFDIEFEENSKGEYESVYDYDKFTLTDNVDELPYMINYDYVKYGNNFEKKILAYLNKSANIEKMATEYYNHKVMLDNAGELQKIMDISNTKYIKALERWFGEDCQVVANIKDAVKPNNKSFTKNVYLAYDYVKDTFYKLNIRNNWEKLNSYEMSILMEGFGGDLPDNKSKNFMLMYENNPILVYNFYEDDNNQVTYVLRCIYDIQPKLVWEDSKGKQHSIDIDGEGLAALDFGSVMIDLPAYSDSGDDTATIWHYFNTDSIGYINSINIKDGTYKITDAEKEELTGSIYKTEKGNFTRIAVTSFSPFEVVDTYKYVEAKPETAKPKDTYIIPKTGVK